MRPRRGTLSGSAPSGALSDLCFDQRADLRTVATDRYGRTVAEVKCGGKDASAGMVRSGFAWVYHQYAKGYGALYPMQAAARAGRRGLWADAAPVRPWEFRHGPAAAVQPDAAGCITGPRGGRYTLSSSGKKHYGC
jgi:endonuclease YncB( thermonuclease family)